ncbi:cytochrome b/b6 domain-containing protein [Novosphingobium sp. Rr 2-17]|uniref:cytochrome b/b6 domain-containing protein n=1 Tax=Novosphingobium sp. Rr 2-17 TaxID=555793 RepID=UPI00030497E3|nr:cytochrome b/b6 domain-containing protein [Novosphingobium sp. Rr 2-17]
MVYEKLPAEERPHRYSVVAIGLHWIIALLIIVIIPMGIWMSHAITVLGSQGAAYRMYQLHKSIGFLILGLGALRLLWRVRHRPPPGSPTLKGWERFLAHTTHAAFYAILLLMPLSGWLYVSSGWAVATDQPLNVATSFFGWFEIPHLLPVAQADPATRRLIAFRSMGFHWSMAVAVIVLIALHTAAALKHQLVDRDGTLGTMVPWLKAPNGKLRTTGRSGRSKALPTLIGIIAVVSAAALPVAFGLVGDAGTDAKAVGPAAAGTTAPAIPASVVRADTPQWTVSNDATLDFSGVHAGTSFAGGFRKWQAHVYFDPKRLPDSKIVILIDTRSVWTGDATQEGTLAEAEWFDVAHFPNARFDSTGMSSLGGDRYKVDGILRVKTQQAPVHFEASIHMTGSRAEAEGAFDLDRTKLDLGMTSDPSAQWVSMTIPVKFRLKAARSE